LPRLRVESECHALVEFFVERPLLHMKNHQLQNQHVSLSYAIRCLLTWSMQTRF
jgi:hypothetical protein